MICEWYQNFKTKTLLLKPQKNYIMYLVHVLYTVVSVQIEIILNEAI